MFISAIESVSKFTRPVNSIIRTYGGKQFNYMLTGDRISLVVYKKQC